MKICVGVAEREWLEVLRGTEPEAAFLAAKRARGPYGPYGRVSYSVKTTQPGRRRYGQLPIRALFSTTGLPCMECIRRKSAVAPEELKTPRSRSGPTGHEVSCT